MSTESGRPLAAVHLALQRPPPSAPPARAKHTAAVAVVLRERGTSFDVLLIRRVRRIDDRWGGHMAFPGGMSAPTDTDTCATAIRETHEEVGLVLGEALGSLRPLTSLAPGRWRRMVVVPWVFAAPRDDALLPDEREVAEALWIPWRALSTEADRAWVPRRIGPIRLPFPAIRYEGRVIWGLTLQMIDSLARVLGSIPPASIT